MGHLNFVTARFYCAIEIKTNLIIGNANLYIGEKNVWQQTNFHDHDTDIYKRHITYIHAISQLTVITTLPDSEPDSEHTCMQYKGN